MDLFEAPETEGSFDMKDLHYTQMGDYYIPDIQLEPQETGSLGKFGRMRRDFLLENNSLLYNHLILSDKLFPHLWDANCNIKLRISSVRISLVKARLGVSIKRRRFYPFLLQMPRLESCSQEPFVEDYSSIAPRPECYHRCNLKSAFPLV